MWSDECSGMKTVYANTCCACLPRHATDAPLDERLAFLRESRHAFGRTALVLSGGGSFGAFHMVGSCCFSHGSSCRLEQPWLVSHALAASCRCPGLSCQVCLTAAAVP